MAFFFSFDGHVPEIQLITISQPPEQAISHKKRMIDIFPGYNFRQALNTPDNFIQFPKIKRSDAMHIVFGATELNKNTIARRQNNFAFDQCAVGKI